MTRTIIYNPVLRGKAAREFKKTFILNAKLDPEKIERNKRDVALYRAYRTVS
jgi:hypothetical protein